MSEIRKFTTNGIEMFNAALDLIDAGQTEDIPQELLFDSELSEIISPHTEIEPVIFSTKSSMVEYLYPKIARLELQDKLFDAGLLTWTAAYYFDSICPKDDKGKRQLRQRARYVTTEAKNWRRYYKHSIALPLGLYASHGLLPKVIFQQPPSGLGDFDEELGSRQDIAMSKGILESADLLYWDVTLQKAKRGATTRNKAGTLRRFITIIQQLEINYDLYSMNGEQILKLFPQHEFRKWIEA